MAKRTVVYRGYFVGLDARWREVRVWTSHHEGHLYFHGPGRPRVKHAGSSPVAEVGKVFGLSDLEWVPDAHFSSVRERALLNDLRTRASTRRRSGRAAYQAAG